MSSRHERAFDELGRSVLVDAIPELAASPRGVGHDMGHGGDASESAVRYESQNPEQSQLVPKVGLEPTRP
jgi:hypothetical protein